MWVRGDFAEHAKHITFLIALLLVSAHHVPVSLTWYVGVQHLSIVQQWWPCSGLIVLSSKPVFMLWLSSCIHTVCAVTKSQCCSSCLPVLQYLLLLLWSRHCVNWLFSSLAMIAVTLKRNRTSLAWSYCFDCVCRLVSWSIFSVVLFMHCGGRLVLPTLCAHHLLNHSNMELLVL